MKIQNLKIYKYFQNKIELIRNNLNRIKNRIKQRFKEYFILENSLGHLNNLLKISFTISIGFNQINCGIKKSKRFIMNILVYILMWILIFQLELFLN